MRGGLKLFIGVSRVHTSEFDIPIASESSSSPSVAHLGTKYLVNIVGIKNEFFFFFFFFFFFYFSDSKKKNNSQGLLESILFSMNVTL